MRKAGSYELHYGPAVNGGAPTTWTTQGVLMVKSPVVLTGLTPGTTYFFQARALLKDGYTDKEVGQTLGISPTTVKTHVGNVFGKMGIWRRAQL